MAFTSSDLRFKVVVDKPTQKITFTEATDYAYWSGGDDYASGLLKITDSIGSVLYENAGYALGDYTAPDVIAQADLKLTVEDIIMNTSSGEIITGDYIVDYKVSTYVAGASATKAIVATAATKTVVISGMIQAEVDSIILFGWLGIETGLNIGSYSIASSVFATGTLTLVLNEAIVDENASVDIVQLNYPAAVEFSTSKTFKFCYTSPTVSIGYSIICSSSQLTSTDDTGYSTTNGTDTLSTYVLVRAHDVTAPAGSGFGTIPTATTASRMFTNIWTKVWQTSIASTLTYDVASFAANEAQVAMVWYQITDSVSGSDDATVACQVCSCDIRLCIYNLTVAWVIALGKSHTTAERLGNDVLKVTAYYTQFLQAERCGADTSGFCELIGEVLEKYGCPCAITEDAPSQLVANSLESILGSDNTWTGINLFTSQVHGGNYTATFNASTTFLANDGNNQQMDVPSNVTIDISGELPGTFIFTFIITSGTAPVITVGSSFGDAADYNPPFLTTNGSKNIVTLVVQPDGSKYYTINTIA